MTAAIKRFGSGDKLDREHYFKWHPISLLAEGPSTVLLQSKDFHTRVRLYDPGGKKALGSSDYLSPDDGGLSRIEVTPNVAGNYQVYVSSSRPNETADYTLTVQQFRPVGVGGKE